MSEKQERAAPRAWQWAWDGACRPGRTVFPNHTFSVGIFQWLPKSGGKGVKRGKVVQRIRGPGSRAEEIYAKAQARCDVLNAAEEAVR